MDRSRTSATRTPDYLPMNEPLEVAESGHRDERPEPLAAARPRRAGLQNGLPIPGKVQPFIGPHWGHVPSFALPPSDAGHAHRPGPAAGAGRPATDKAFKDEAVEIIRRSHLLDATNGVTIDIGPGAFGDNTLGANDGNGHDVNPVTGQPYEPHVVLQADFARARRVLGRRAQVGDAARPLERASPTRSPTRPASRSVSAARAIRSTGSSGTPSCTSRSTARSTTRRSRRGA